MKFKKLLVILILIPFVFFTGCWDSHEMNTLAITVCIGIDKEKGDYLISEQVINPRVIASKRSTNECPVTVYTARGKDINLAIKSLTTKCSRKIYNAHLRMVVIGQKVAEDGIKDILDYFLRSREYRTDFYFAIAKNRTAEEILSVLTTMESIPGISMYDSLKMSNHDWAPTKAIRIIELSNCIISDGINPVITGIDVSDGSITPSSTNDLRLSNGIKKLRYSNIGVFKKDKFVGWLTTDESKGYKYIIGDVKKTTAYSYYDDKAKITADVTKAKSKINVFLVNNKPNFNVLISLKQNIVDVEGDFDVSKVENKKIMNEIAEKKTKLICEESVNAAQKEFGTDIFGFGEAVHRKYPKLWQKIKDKWDTEFIDVPVNINVSVKTDQLGEITKPLFIKEKK